MALHLPDNWESLTKQAVAHYWKTLEAQAKKQATGSADRGRRRDVTGGKQMDGFSKLVAAVAVKNGMPTASIYTASALEIPGYFRATKRWDMLVVDGGRLVAALEFKSHRGPSFSNNFNNRTEEALGNATDVWTAYREGAFGSAPPAPWLGWVMMLDDCKASTRAVKVAQPHFATFPEFHGTSYRDRYAILLRKLVLEKHYNAAALVTASETTGRAGKYSEPADDLTMRRFLLAFAGAVATHVASGATR